MIAKRLMILGRVQGVGFRFAMIDVGLMRKTDEDTPDHFQGVFDFEEAFGDLSITK